MTLYPVHLVLFACLETESHSADQAGLGLTEITCLCFKRTGIKGVHHHSQLTKSHFKYVFGVGEVWHYDLSIINYLNPHILHMQDLFQVIC